MKITKKNLRDCLSKRIMYVPKWNHTMTKEQMTFLAGMYSAYTSLWLQFFPGEDPMVEIETPKPKEISVVLCFLCKKELDYSKVSDFFKNYVPPDGFNKATICNECLSSRFPGGERSEPKEVL